MNHSTYIRPAASLFVALSCLALSSMGGADSVAQKRGLNPQEPFFAPVPKAVCGPGDRPETALQGQVTKEMREAGFQGFSCNLQLIGQVRGEGANWQTTEFREGRGKRRLACAYHGTAAPTANPGMQRTNYGVRVIDISNPANPYNTAYLTTSAMLDPWESLKVNERRKLLGAVNGQNGGGGSEIDIYDISGDCRHPQLLTSTPVATPTAAVIGHEGSWAPDGLTYYGSGRGGWYAVDTTDTTKPKLLANWQRLPGFGGGPHGLSISDDGMRGYYVGAGSNAGTLTDPLVQAVNGLLIWDLSEIQARRENPQVRLVGSFLFKDGSTAQHTIPVKIKGTPYVIFVDEGGSGGIASAAQFAQACAAGLSPFPMARILDMTDETNPVEVSKLMLETHDPANCDAVAPDVAGLTIFTYGSHYCSVDNRSRATTLACGYFNSGIRIFDIRDPYRPREIAYYNPAGTTTASSGSNHLIQNNWIAGRPDWCSAQVHLDADLGTVWTTCQDNGLLSLKFTHNAWPFAETRTPPGRQN